MPDDKFIYDYSLAAMTTFYDLVEQAFAFLPATYDCRLHSKHLDDIEVHRDTRTTVTYVGKKIEVDIFWDIASATIEVWFVELQIPRVSPTKRVTHGEGKEGARQIDLHTLAEALGHTDDPDFMLGVEPADNARIINKRFKLLQTNFAGVIAALAGATERYGRDILLGDTSIFPQVMHLYGEKRRAQGFW